MTATKKRDTMLPLAQAATGGTTSVGGYDMAANPTSPAHFFLWTATGRTFGGGGAVGLRGQRAARSSTTCFMRGLSETVSLETTNDVAWEWRRICFCAKLGGERMSVGTTSATGYARLLRNIGTSSNPTDVASVTFFSELVFQGTTGVDYYDIMDAKVDTTRVDLKYDRKVMIRSGNAQAVKRTKKMWHPMNKNLVYDDEENGNSEGTVAQSVRDKRGMGDYYVMDLFRSVGPTASGSLNFSAESCLYWHEK